MKNLKDNLSPAMKLRLRRWLIGAAKLSVTPAAACYRMGRRVLDRLVENGLDLHRAWDVTSRSEHAHQPEPWGVQNFLSLMDARAGRRLASDAGGEVQASVVITTRNNVELTFQCLLSLFRAVDFEQTEVIVVNDGSTDETNRMLAHFRDFIRVLDNANSRGLVDACIQAAEAARGRYLIFLNNKTVVAPDWLKCLIETVEQDEHVGAVGSLIVYPDGRLKEAGGIVWKDGVALHYGRGQSPEDRRFNFARPVDFCSSTSLLVQRELFQRLGGFDGSNTPDYEDVDFCFGVRRLGYRVVYQPLSRVTHYESATPRQEDTTSNLKPSQIANREKFRAKWRETLEREHHENRPTNVERASAHGDAPRVLVFDDHLPAPDRDAGSARMAFILRSLARWSRPVFISLGKGRPVHYERQLWFNGIETASAVDYLRLIRERRFVAAILSRPVVAETFLASIRRADLRVRIVFDMVDAHFLRLEREASLTGDARVAKAARRFRKLETRIARASDLVWCTSDEDRVALERAAGPFKAAIVPTIHSVGERGLPFGERRDLLFVGNFVHAPNRDAMQFLTREIMPALRESLPRVSLLVVGDNVPEEIAACASADVRVLGFVPDIKPLYASARVMVAPLRFGAGVKGKIGESLAHGLPVVTTEVGAEGMGLSDGAEALIVSDDPREFASAVARAYTDPELWRQLSDNGYRHIAMNFTPEVIERIVASSLKKLIGLQEN
ncbi:MAG TPA: glycosyltransferase [Pyrinomonadaceae bacterium]|nr:glycosyltransferase [Pyrinomonadaceae bacterium]